jgi:MFS family permease
MIPKGHNTAKGKLDVLGAILFIFVIIPLFIALGEGQEVGFTNPIILLSFFIASISFIAFIIIERKRENPLLQLQIFENKLFSLSIFCAFISYMVIFCSMTIHPLYLQDVMKFSPSYAGLILMGYPIIVFIVAPISGYLSDKIGSEIFTFIGLVITGLGLLLMSTLNSQSSVITIILFMAVASLGNGLFQAPNNSLVMSTVTSENLGIAGSVNSLVRNLGTVCGITLSTTLLYNRMSYKIGHHVTDYIVGKNDEFVYGMKVVYLTAVAICMIGAILTALRLFSNKAKLQDTVE